MNKKNKNQKATREMFFNSFRKEDELDESTFDLWKTELQKNFTDFWESMRD